MWSKLSSFVSTYLFCLLLISFVYLCLTFTICRNKFIRDFSTSKRCLARKKNSDLTIMTLNRGVIIGDYEPHKIKVFLCLCFCFILYFYYILTNCRQAYDQQKMNEINHYSPLAITTSLIVGTWSFQTT